MAAQHSDQVTSWSLLYYYLNHCTLQVLFSLEDNLKLLTAACQQQNKAEHDDRDEGKGVLTVGVEQLIKAVTSNNVLELVTHNLLQS